MEASTSASGRCARSSADSSDWVPTTFTDSAAGGSALQAGHEMDRREMEDGPGAVLGHQPRDRVGVADVGDGELHAVAAGLSRRPVRRSSRASTSSPASTRLATSREPTKPQAPVTSTLTG